jgi:hypothetical protein
MMRGRAKVADSPHVKHHLVIVKPRFAALLLAGRKQIECRMGAGPFCPPWQSVSVGDMLWLKITAGPVVAKARAARVLELACLTRDHLVSLRRQFGRAIAADHAYWNERRRARWAVLIWLDGVRDTRPFRIEKKDGRAWVVLRSAPRPGKKPTPARVRRRRNSHTHDR